jgi:prepilin-type N-terminal cleavage/methylation domain-containing protein
MARRSRGFTLIELLVVVAIIALLISILLPSLNQARAQSRTTLCASRIAQLQRAMLMYSEDFNERPPFIATGMSNPSQSVEELKAEDWISKDMDQMWTAAEADWPPGTCPRSGSLFPYSRFESLYRCPEFERIPNKTQSVFNYTRNLFGRQLIPPWEPGGTTYYQVFGLGHIMRPAEIYAPSQMFMLVDESWQFHVADMAHYQTRYIDGARCADPIWFPFSSEFGQYHGPAVRGVAVQRSAEGMPVPTAIKRAGLGYYDGHVGFERDKVPGRNLSEVLTWLPAAIEWALEVVFAQRGIMPTLEQVGEALSHVLG